MTISIIFFIIAKLLSKRSALIYIATSLYSLTPSMCGGFLNVFRALKRIFRGHLNSYQSYELKNLVLP